MSQQSPRILIVDDDQDILANLSDILTDLGFDTDTAASGEIAMEKVYRCELDRTKRSYDLCLLDFKMPGMDGVELCQRIRQHYPQLRAIMITAYAGDDGVQRAVDAGTWKVLHKPVDIKMLLSMIHEAVA